MIHRDEWPCRLMDTRELPADVVPRGLEPRTLRLLAVRSNQLSYETFEKHIKFVSVKTA
jgi:hypothetical protein